MGATEDRAFPKPWSIIEAGECFKVVDRTGFPVCYIYFEDEAGRADRTERPNRKQAGALASKIAKLPELMELLGGVKMAAKEAIAGIDEGIEGGGKL